MRGMRHKSPTLCGDKEEKERRQTITCQRFHPNTGYLFHLIYAYITQGRLTQRTHTIITQRIGVYATPLIQPTQASTRTAQGNPVYIYHPTATARLPVPSDNDVIFFSDASGIQQRNPTVSCASLRISGRADGLHVEHAPGLSSSSVFPRRAAHPGRYWQHHTATHNNPAPQHLGHRRHHGRHSSHKAPGRTTPSQGPRNRPHHAGVVTADGLNRHAPQGHPAHGQTEVPTLRIRQWTRKHACQTPEHKPAPELKHIRPDTPHHSNLQQLHPIPPAAQPPHRVPDNRPYTDRDKQYHYRKPIQQLATTLGHRASTKLLPRLGNSIRTPLYYVASCPNSPPAHLQKPGLQLALEQLPLLTRHYRLYPPRSIHIPAGYTQCICGHTEDKTWAYFKTCPLYRGLDTLTDWNPAHSIAQHAVWPTQSPATQKLTNILRQTGVLEAVRRGLVPSAVSTLLQTHADNPQTTAAHMQRMAVTKTATQLTYRTHRHLQHAATLRPTDQANCLKLLFYQP